MSEVKVGDVIVFTGDNVLEFGRLGVVECNMSELFGDTWCSIWSVNIGERVNEDWPEDAFEVIDHIESNDELLEASAEVAQDFYTAPYKIGDKVKYIGNDFSEIVGLVGTVKEIDIEFVEDLIQFSNGKIYSINRMDLKLDNSNDLYSYPIQDLINWRDTASKRVTKVDSDLLYLSRTIEDMFVKYDRLNKKRISDSTWISKLNNILYKRVIKDRN